MAAVRRAARYPMDRSDQASPWDRTSAGPGDVAGASDLIEGGAPSRYRQRMPAWKRPRLPRRRWVVGVVVGIALVGGGTAVAWRVHSADHLPSLAAVRASAAASSGLLGWAPRGHLVRDDGFLRDALQALRSSGSADRPRTRLHLLYAGGQVVLLEGRDRHGRVSLAQVVGGEVLAERLLQPEPVALTLPAGPRLRFLVPPATRGAPGPAVVWVQDASTDPAGGFRALPADTSGLTAEFEPAPGETRFVVLEPRVNEVGMPSGDRLAGDGLTHAGSLIPTVPPNVRLTGSPWSVEGDQAPSRQWLADAEVLAAALPVGAPVRVASLTGYSGFTPGPPRPDATTYSGALYAVTDAAGQDYVGYVLRFGDEPLCHRLTPVGGRFADLLVVGDRCTLRGESVAAVLQVITRPDVRHGTVELSGLAGRPPQRVPIAGGASSGLVDFLGPAYPTVTLSATTGSESATYVVPSP